MKQKWLQVIALFLCMAMLVTACGTGTGGKETDAEKTTAGGQKETDAGETQGGTGETQGEEKDIFPLEEKVTFTIAVQGLNNSKKNVEEKQCVIKTEEGTNVHIEWIEIPASGWKERINLMFNTEELPDAIIGNVDFEKYSDYILPLDDLLPEYAPEIWAYMQTVPGFPDCLKTSDGVIRGLPKGDLSPNNMVDSNLWINQKWLTELGLDMPETPEQFKEVLIAFRDRDPNGNGQADEIPFLFQNIWGYANMVENFFGTFGVLESDNHVMTIDGQVVFSPAQEGYYNALVYLNELYKENLIDKEVFTMSDDVYFAKGSSGGDVDVLGVFAGWAPQNVVCINQNDYVMMPLMSDGTSDKMVGVNNIAGPGFFITEECETPEILVQWYEYINSTMETTYLWNLGPEGYLYEFVEVDGVKRPQSKAFTEETKQLTGWSSFAECRQSESFAGMSLGWYTARWNPIEDETAAGTIRQRAIENYMLPYAVTTLPAGTATAENAERRGILKTDIDTYLQNFTSNAVLNGLDEAAWQEHLNTLKDLKVEEYVALCQEFVDAMK